MPAYKGRRQTVNHHAFSEVGLEESYWAGFIAADGYIFELKQAKKKQSRLTIKIKESDREHLEKFSDFIGELNVGLITEKTQNDRKYVAVNIYSQKICDDLRKNYLITEKKSLTLEPPQHLDHENSLAFIAGYIDGDGCYDVKVGRPRLSLLGTENMLIWARQILGSVHDKVQKQHNGNVYAIEFYGDTAIKARQLFINMPLPFLERKYKLWESRGADLRMSHRARKFTKGLEVD